MYSTRWATSERRYDVAIERDVQVRMSDGVTLVGNIWRPASPARFPVVLGAHPYNQDLQSGPMRPVGFTPLRGYMESGDPTFFARRGYAHAVFNVRGSGKSGGYFEFLGPREIQDMVELIEWLAEQSWSSGKVAMFGVSYYAMIGQLVACAQPKPLKAIFAPFAGTDDYRDFWYHGGILGHGFLTHYRHSLHNPRVRSRYKELAGEEAYRQAIQAAKQDEELMAVPALREALQAPDQGTNPLLVDYAINPLDGPLYRLRQLPEQTSTVPAYLGGCWGIYALHLPGAFRSWAAWRGPKKMVVGPPIYLDRPFYQYHDLALRWFDHWLKGVDTGIMDEPPIRAFMPPTGEWQDLEDWPPANAIWHRFYLHSEGLLSEHEMWPGEGVDTFEESSFGHGSLTYASPPLVETTAVLGPIAINLHVSTTDTDALLFVTLLLIDREGKEHELTRGWLRASQRRLREDSQPWAPVLAHTERELLEPGKIYELRFPIVETARVFQPGERIAIRIKGADDEPAHNALQLFARNHLRRPKPARITIHHDEDRLSYVDLPVTRGNVIGTFISGGDIESSFGLSG